MKDAMGKAESSSSQRLKSCILALAPDQASTSALTGLLVAIGCQPPASAASRAASGSSLIEQFNDELLASAGSSRDDFTPFYEGWMKSPRAREFLDRAALLLKEEFGDADLFALSDPSMCRILPFWIEVLDQFGCTPNAMIVTRDPLDVSGSLRSMNGQNEALSQVVWLRNMLEGEYGTRQIRRVCTSFDQLMNGWQNVALKMQDALHLVWPKSMATAEFEVAATLDSVRREEAATRSPGGLLLPPWLQQTSEIFSRWAAREEESRDHQELDRIRSEFDVAANAFARVIRSDHTDRRFESDAGQRARGPGYGVARAAGEASDIPTLKTQLQELRRKTTLLNADLHQQMEAREALESQLIAAQTELEASQARRKEMARVINNRESKIKRLYEEMAVLQREIVRSSPSGQVKAAVRRVRRAVRGGGREQRVPEAPSVS